jgi:S-adenosylmethionine:tRNA ribosyltransferase-isomerase
MEEKEEETITPEMEEKIRKAEKEFGFNVYDLNEYDYELPKELIAQTPAEKRDQSRLLVLNKKTGELEDKIFCQITDYLRPGDVIVRNNTKVIPARLLGLKEGTGARIEILLLNQDKTEKNVWTGLVGNAKAVKAGTVVDFGQHQEMKATCLQVLDEGLRVFRLDYQGIFYEVLDQLGKMPLPPYIKNQEGKNDRYQTVYAQVEGSAAAPTAGFHFTEELFKKIEDMGVEVIDVTLHVGLGTFRPVKVSNILNHKMHSEYFEVSAEAADRLNLAKKEGRRIIAVGTTSVRTLETVYHEYGRFQACHEDTSLFIYPGFRYEAVDALITNFHLPKSTLVMLVSAFASREMIMKAYKHAIENKYRFFSFGDAMFIHE